MVEDEICAVTNYLDNLSIQYTLLRHEAVFSCEESREKIKVENCCACKNLFVKDTKSGFYYLIVLRSDKRADLRSLCSYVGAKRFVFASDEQLKEKLNVAYGMVSPFGLLNDKEGKTRLMIDEDLLNSERVKFHPNNNTATIVLNVIDFIRYIDSLNKHIIKVKTDFE
ncbi:MAG: YbaK/EbsC family protein [Clostridia bacterium]